MKIKSILGAAVLAVGMTAVSPIVLADASPGDCGGGPFVSFCDGPAQPNGSFWHCVSGGFIGWGAHCGYVCDNGTMFPTPNDGRSPC